MTHLSYLSLSKIPVQDKLSRYVLSGLRNLKSLSLGAMQLTDIEEFAFETLTSLVILDIQANSLHYLRNHTFFGLRSLKMLFLRRNNLRFFEGYLPFLHMPLLRELSIEYNQIDTLPGQIFSSLTNLKRLFLSENKIVPWKSRIFHSNLTVTVLQLSGNQITYVTPIMLTEFSQVSEYLDLSKNPFNCSTCGMKELQAFFRHSNLTFSLHSKAQMDPLSYTCKQPVFLLNRPIKDVELPIVNCEIEEATLISLFAVALICFIIISILLISFLCYFFWWYIRYWIFHIQARMKEGKFSHPYEPRYVYDAFVSYNSENTPWVLTYLLPALEAQEPTFKLCVHERDFQVGALITENILEAIDGSKKVILVLSESFIKSEWCMFELHMAQHKLFDDIRDALILVKLENIDKKLYTKNLLYLEKTRLCLEWTE
ncbi:Toll-like receptor 2, partial [Stegodyphus mimosarum]